MTRFIIQGDTIRPTERQWIGWCNTHLQI